MSPRPCCCSGPRGCAVLLRCGQPRLLSRPSSPCDSPRAYWSAQDSRQRHSDGREGLFTKSWALQSLRVKSRACTLKQFVFHRSRSVMCYAIAVGTTGCDVRLTSRSARDASLCCDRVIRHSSGIRWCIRVLQLTIKEALYVAAGYHGCVVEEV